MNTEDEASDGPVVIFDGVCVLCSHVVQFIVRHEAEPVIRFASTQSAIGQRLAAEHGIPPATLDETFLVLTANKALTRSDAAIEVARHLRWPWRALSALKILPRPLRDAAYTAIARRRYRLFGQMKSCFMPEPAMRWRFLDMAPPAEPPS